MTALVELIQSKPDLLRDTVALLVACRRELAASVAIVTGAGSFIYWLAVFAGNVKGW